MGIVTQLENIEAAVRLRLHELGSRVGVSDGWCVHDKLSKPEHHYPQDEGSWGEVKFRTMVVANARPFGMPVVMTVSYDDNRHYMFELYEKGRDVIMLPLNNTELTLLHEIAEEESRKLAAGEHIDFRAVIDRVQQIASKIDSEQS